MHNQHNASVMSHMVLTLVGLSTSVWALLPQNANASFADTAQCSMATARVERALQLPDGFLGAISRVETGRPQADGRRAAWPWSVNAAGVGHQYASMHDAIEAVKTFQNQGIQSIDVGCMQVNLMHHPNAFSSLESAFDPQTNALYAGHFLQQMHDKTGSWPRAAAAYHSQNPTVGEPYLSHVLSEWAVPQDGRPLTPTKSTTHHVANAPNTLTPVSSRLSTSLPAHQPAAPLHAPLPRQSFHPFQGMSHSSASATPRRTSATQQGRSLASYRAAPVRMVTSMPYPSAY